MEFFKRSIIVSLLTLLTSLPARATTVKFFSEYNLSPCVGYTEQIAFNPTFKFQEEAIECGLFLFSKQASENDRGEQYKILMKRLEQIQQEVDAPVAYLSFFKQFEGVFGVSAREYTHMRLPIDPPYAHSQVYRQLLQEIHQLRGALVGGHLPPFYQSYYIETMIERLEYKQQLETAILTGLNQGTGFYETQSEDQTALQLNPIDWYQVDINRQDFVLNFECLGNQCGTLKVDENANRSVRRLILNVNIEVADHVKSITLMAFREQGRIVQLSQASVESRDWVSRSADGQALIFDLLHGSLSVMQEYGELFFSDDTYFWLEVELYDKTNYKFPIAKPVFTGLFS